MPTETSSARTAAIMRRINSVENIARFVDPTGDWDVDLGFSNDSTHPVNGVGHSKSSNGLYFMTGVDVTAFNNTELLQVDDADWPSSSLISDYNEVWNFVGNGINQNQMVVGRNGTTVFQYSYPTLPSPLFTHISLITSGGSLSVWTGTERIHRGGFQLAYAGGKVLSEYIPYSPDRQLALWSGSGTPEKVEDMGSGSGELYSINGMASGITTEETEVFLMNSLYLSPTERRIEVRNLSGSVIADLVWDATGYQADTTHSLSSNIMSFGPGQLAVIAESRVTSTATFLGYTVFIFSLDLTRTTIVSQYLDYSLSGMGDPFGADSDDSGTIYHRDIGSSSLFRQVWKLSGGGTGLTIWRANSLSSSIGTFPSDNALIGAEFHHDDLQDIQTAIEGVLGFYKRSDSPQLTYTLSILLGDAIGQSDWTNATPAAHNDILETDYSEVEAALAELEGADLA